MLMQNYYFCCYLHLRHHYLEEGSRFFNKDLCTPLFRETKYSRTYAGIEMLLKPFSDASKDCF